MTIDLPWLIGIVCLVVFILGCFVFICCYCCCRCCKKSEYKSRSHDIETGEPVVEQNLHGYDVPAAGNTYTGRFQQIQKKEYKDVLRSHDIEKGYSTPLRELNLNGYSVPEARNAFRDNFQYLPKWQPPSHDIEEVYPAHLLELNLHGYSVSAARDAFKDRFQQIKKMRGVFGEYGSFTVIVGRGLHSVNQIPKIKPEIAGILDQWQIPYEYTHKGGAIRILLRSMYGHY